MAPPRFSADAHGLSMAMERRMDSSSGSRSWPVSAPPHPRGRALAFPVFGRR
jgi:hypothetical protein